MTTLLLLALVLALLTHAGIDLAVTAAEVKAGAGAVEGTGVAGAAVTAGQPVYEDATDGKLKLADSNLSLASAKARGFALHAALENQPLRYQKGGKFIKGATAPPVKGKTYVVSATAGGIAPIDDVVAGWHVTILGVGDGVSGIDMLPGGPFASGHAVP